MHASWKWEVVLLKRWLTPLGKSFHLLPDNSNGVLAAIAKIAHLGGGPSGGWAGSAAGGGGPGDAVERLPVVPGHPVLRS